MIPTASYIEYALDLTSAEQHQISSFRDWLPHSIIDCHVHSNPPSSVLAIDDELYLNMVTTFPHFTVEQHRQFTELFYPGREVTLLPFTMPYRGIDFRMANDYLAEAAKAGTGIRPVLYGLPDDPEYTIRGLSDPSFVGLKMYMLYFRPPATRISQYFTDEILSEANRIGATVILHPPSPVSSSCRDIVDTATRFPNVTFVIAHMGSLTLSSTGVEAAYKALAPFPNLLFDTAIVPSREIIGLGLDIFGHERILYGTDQPLSLVRANVYMNPALGERLASPYPYHWADRSEQLTYASHAEGAAHLHWSVLTAIRQAIADYGETPEVVEDIFCNNARRAFKL